MSMFGADIAALRGFASSLLRRKQEIEVTRQRLATIVETLPWSGSDHDRFVEEWRQVLSPGLMRLVGELSSASRDAYHHADQQEQASRRWS